MSASHATTNNESKTNNDIQTKVTALLPKYIDLAYNKKDRDLWYAKLCSLASDINEVTKLQNETVFLEQNQSYIPKDTFILGTESFMREIDCLYFLMKYLPI